MVTFVGDRDKFSEAEIAVLNAVTEAIVLVLIKKVPPDMHLSVIASVAASWLAFQTAAPLEATDWLCQHIREGVLKGLAMGEIAGSA